MKILVKITLYIKKISSLDVLYVIIWLSEKKDLMKKTVKKNYLFSLKNKQRTK